MSRFAKQSIILVAYILIDIAFISLSIFLACWFRESKIPFDPTFQNIFFESVNPFRSVFITWIIVSIIINNSHGLYRTKREIIESVELWEVLKSVVLSALTAIVVIYLFKIERFPRSILILTSFFMTIFLSLWRIFKRVFVNYLVSNGYNNFNILIIGAGKVGQTLEQEIKKKPQLGLKVVGFLDDYYINEGKRNSPKILGKVTEFKKVVRNEFINQVYITIHHDGDMIIEILEQAKKLGVAVRVIPHGFDLMSGDLVKYNIGIIPILEYCEETPFRKQAGKRLFDFLMISLSILFVFPIYVMIAVLIKLDSRGPVFYRSRRYGRRGKVFSMYKFRSMFIDADEKLEDLKGQNEVDGPIFKMKNDPRVTRIGRILRKYSMDELPQLINVIKGDMSLVGPRPLPIEQIRKEDLRQLRRLEVRPGITGLWQVKGRSDISFTRLVKWDMWYINNWSFWLDLNILLQTIPVVIKGKGAY